MSSSCGCGCGGGCGELPTRFPISNPSGLSQIAYRVGDFATFRRALLQHLDGETELDVWRPTAGSDLGQQVLDWWAYIADILTFYNERIANEDYLGTAQQESSVRRLVSLLGYRPRPGIGATGTVAVLASSPAPLLVPACTGIASKATPELKSQVFETTAVFKFDPPTSVAAPTADDLQHAPPTNAPPASAAPGTAEAPAHAQLIARGGVLLKGSGTLKPGDRLLLIAKSWTSVNGPVAVVTVQNLVTEKDPHGRTNTRVVLSGTGGLPANAVSADYRLARDTHAAHLSTLPANATVITGSELVLDSPARYLAAGEPLLVETPGAADGLHYGTGFVIARLTQYAEKIWYANANSSTPTTSPGDNGIAIAVADLSVDAPSGSNLGGLGGATRVTVHGGWTDVGTLLDTPVATLTALPATLTLARPPVAGAGVATNALVVDGNGDGTTVTATPTAGSGDLTIAPADPDATLPALRTPLRVLWDLIEISRGQTVRDEKLGTGDATAAGQDFTLSKYPVTFLADQPGRSGDGYSSTAVLTVDGRYWTEVPMLYGHGPDDAVFETYVDDDGKTHVRTGDGQTGRRLATGAKVSATYRTGSGAAVPAPGALSLVLNAVPNLRSVQNPVSPGGGSDPQPAGELRSLAPRSVLTFGRAISGDDYAAIAAAAPGVTRAAAAFEWDAEEQRPVVRVYVGDDQAAVTSARAALAAQADPNRPLLVVEAIRHRFHLQLTLVLDPSYVATDVGTAVTSALVDGLFAPGVLGLGEVLYRSRIEEVVLAVPGVLATRGLTARWTSGFWYRLFWSGGTRFDPGAGGFFTLSADDLALSDEGPADDGDTGARPLRRAVRRQAVVTDPGGVPRGRQPDPRRRRAAARTARPHRRVDGGRAAQH